MMRIPVEAIRISAKQFAGAWALKHAGLALGIAAACFMSNGYSAPMPPAADRVFLGDNPGIPLAANTDPETARTLDALRQQAANTGAVRVIVGVRAAFAPEGSIPDGDVALQRDEIAAAQSAALDKVASLKGKPEKIKRFEIIPFMAVEATPAELEALVNLPEITSIEEDRIAEPTLAQSVPLIGGATAWSSGYTGAGRAIAILDTGVEKSHPFLAGKVVSEACYSSNYAPDGATSICPGGIATSTATGSAMPYAGTCPAGECDHGTHVAGIAAGKGTGYSGVAKGASLIAIQIFSRFQNATYCGSSAPCVLSYTSDQIMGLQRVYALRAAYSIAAVNMSLGGGQYFDQASCDAANLSRKAIIDTLRSANIATVISSGNSGYTDSIGAPGCISSAVSVGATWDAAGNGNNCAGHDLGISAVNQIACYSNSAPFLNLLAPGSAITSSTPGNVYGANWHGTSMAAPHVAGAWALLKQKNQSLTVTEALNTLTSTGVSVTDSRNSIVKPRIQVNAALNAIEFLCTYALGSNSLSAGAAAVIGSISVTAGSSCAWTAVSNAAWITVTSSASGSGNGTVSYSITTNTSTNPRTGIMTIAGKKFTVTQAGYTLPAAPIIGTASAGNGSAMVAFAPGAIGSGTLVNYTATCGNISATGTSSPIMVAGLANSTAYTCKVRTTSTVGTGPWSAPSNTVTPSESLVLPVAPTIGKATAGNGNILIAFTPGTIGDGTLVNYTAMCGYFSATGTGSPITVSGLINGTAYRCKARATSTVGIGPWSELSNAVTPAAGKGSRRYDFNGDGKADILWRNTATGVNQIWFMSGTTKTGAPNTNTLAVGWSTAVAADFNGDGKTDILWRNAAGQNQIWLMNGVTRLSSATISPLATPWAFAGTGDFDGDGKADILWRNTTTGVNQIWFMNGMARTGTANTVTLASGWFVAGVADFNGDGKADILWHNAAGQNSVWLMNGAALISSTAISPAMAAPWTIAGTGDFNGDGKADILWRNTATGQNQIWFMDGMVVTSIANTITLAANWFIAQVADFNGDSKADILGRNAAGQNYVWLMNGAARISSAALSPVMATPWTVVR